MDRLDYFFRQLVTEAELDAGFEAAEVADRALITDNGLVGVAKGLDATETSPTPAISVDIATGVAYDQAGQRIHVDQVETVGVSVDNAASSTDVTTPGNTKIVSVFVEFERDLQDPRVDGDSNTVFFERNESYAFFVKQGAESAGTPPLPALESGRILLCDITRSFGQTQILDADINIDRREDSFKVAAGSVLPALSEGTAEEALATLFTYLDNHLAGVAGFEQSSGTIEYDGGPNWADGTTNPSTNLESQLDKIITDLALTSSPGGADRIGMRAVANTFFSESAGPLGDFLQNHMDTVDAFVTELATTDYPTSGSALVGYGAELNSEVLSDQTVQFNMNELDKFARLSIMRDIRAASPASVTCNGASTLATPVEIPAFTDQPSMQMFFEVGATPSMFVTQSGEWVKTASKTTSLAGTAVASAAGRSGALIARSDGNTAFERPAALESGNMIVGRASGLTGIFGAAYGFTDRFFVFNSTSIETTTDPHTDGSGVNWAAVTGSFSGNVLGIASNFTNGLNVLVTTFGIYTFTDGSVFTLQHTFSGSESAGWPVYDPIGFTTGFRAAGFFAAGTNSSGSPHIWHAGISGNDWASVYAPWIDDLPSTADFRAWGGRCFGVNNDKILVAASRSRIIAEQDILRVSSSAWAMSRQTPTGLYLTHSIAFDGATDAMVYGFKNDSFRDYFSNEVAP